LVWLLEHVNGLRTLAEQGHVAFGTIDSWLIWNLTQGAQHVIEVSNASRTMLMNLSTQQWDEELLDLFNIPSALLPKSSTRTPMSPIPRQAYSVPIFRLQAY
jgi:glycerol kinase